MRKPTRTQLKKLHHNSGVAYERLYNAVKFDYPKYPRMNALDPELADKITRALDALHSLHWRVHLQLGLHIDDGTPEQPEFPEET